MNNNNNLEKFIENIESIKMTQYEKNEMRQHLSSFAMNYSAPKSPYHSVLLTTKRIVAVAFVAIISVGSLSQFASNDALPGDTLYPVKMVHEKIKLATTNGETRKINFEIKQTEKRIQEATQLAQKEKLNPEKEKEIAKVIRELTTRVKTHIEEVKEDNPESALILNSELKSTIRANSDVLRKVTLKQDKRLTLKEKVDLSLPEKETTLIEEENLTQKSSQNLDIPEISEYDNEEIISDTIQEELENKEKTSLALSLLDSLDVEVEEIEALEIKVENEIIKDEVITEEENIPQEDTTKKIVEEVTSINVIAGSGTTSKEINPEDNRMEPNTIKAVSLVTAIDPNKEVWAGPPSETQQKENLNNEIKSLKDIIKIKDEIIEIKSESSPHEHNPTEINDVELFIFNEKEIQEKVEKLIQEKKYKQAFIQLQSILEHYQEEKIELKAEKKLGIENTEIQDEMETNTKEIQASEA